MIVSFVPFSLPPIVIGWLLLLLVVVSVQFVMLTSTASLVSIQRAFALLFTIVRFSKLAFANTLNVFSVVPVIVWPSPFIVTFFVISVSLSEISARSLIVSPSCAFSRASAKLGYLTPLTSHTSSVMSVCSLTSSFATFETT